MPSELPGSEPPQNIVSSSPYDKDRTVVLAGYHPRDDNTEFAYKPNQRIEKATFIAKDTLGGTATRAIQLRQLSVLRRIGLSKIINMGPVTSKFFRSIDAVLAHFSNGSEESPEEVQDLDVSDNTTEKGKKRFSGAFFSNYMRFHQREILEKFHEETSAEALHQRELELNTTLMGASGSWTYETVPVRSEASEASTEIYEAVLQRSEKSEASAEISAEELITPLIAGLYEASSDMEAAAQTIFYKVMANDETRQLLGAPDTFKYQDLFLATDPSSRVLAQFIEILNSQTVYAVDSATLGKTDWGPVRLWAALVQRDQANISARKATDKGAIRIETDRMQPDYLGRRGKVIPALDAFSIAERTERNQSNAGENAVRTMVRHTIDLSDRFIDNYSKNPMFEIKITASQDTAQQLALSEFSKNGAVCRLVLVTDTRGKVQNIKAVFNHFHCAEKQGQYIMYKLHKQLRKLDVDLAFPNDTFFEPEVIHRSHNPNGSNPGEVDQVMTKSAFEFSQGMSELFKLARSGDLAPSQSAVLATVIAGLNESTVFNCVDPEVGDLAISLFPSGTDIGKVLQKSVRRLESASSKEEVQKVVDDFIRESFGMQAHDSRFLKRIRSFWQKKEIESGQPKIGEQNRFFRQLRALFQFSKEDTALCKESAGLLQVLDTLNDTRVVNALRAIFPSSASILEGGSDQISSVGHFDEVFRKHINLGFTTACSPQATRGVALDSSLGHGKILSIRERFDAEVVRKLVTSYRARFPSLPTTEINELVEKHLLKVASDRLADVKKGTLLLCLALVTIDPTYGTEIKQSARDRALEELATLTSNSESA